MYVWYIYICINIYIYIHMCIYIYIRWLEGQAQAQSWRPLFGALEWYGDDSSTYQYDPIFNAIPTASFTLRKTSWYADIVIFGTSTHFHKSDGKTPVALFGTTPWNNSLGECRTIGCPGVHGLCWSPEYESAGAKSVQLVNGWVFGDSNLDKLFRWM